MVKLILHILLTETRVSKIRKAFVNGSSASMKFSKTQLSKMIQSEECATSNIPIFGFTSPFKGADKTVNKAGDLFIKKCHLLM